MLGPMDLRLMDIDAFRLETVHSFCTRLLGGRNADISLSATQTAADAVKGCDFILLQLRQGGQDMRILDEKLGKKHRIPFVETVSICGFSTFLRTYYEYERLASIILENAQDAWVMNFTNPAGQLTETLNMLGIDRVVGVCNGWIGMREIISRLSGLPVDGFFMNWRGLNHLTFTDAVYDGNGRNILPDLLNKLFGDQNDYPIDAELMKTLGCFPNSYVQYYYNRRKMIDKLQKQERVRSEIVKDLDKELINVYKTASTIPDSLRKRGGFGYSGAVVSILKGIWCNEGSIHYAVTKNHGTLCCLPDDAMIECPVIAKKSGVYAVNTGDLPEFARPIAITIKAYERMAICGAKERNRDKLLTSMMMHPLIGDYSIAKPMLEECLDMNRDYIPTLFGRSLKRC
jgi:6-phospho-beta-glucosidase